MKNAVALLACLAGANAFSSAPMSKASSALQMSVFDDYPGAVDFRGKKFEFDPLGLAETYPPLVPWFRECEVRHGRTAMLAVMGFIATDFMRIPGEMYSFEAIPKTIDAHDALLKSGPMYQLVLWIGLWDLVITTSAMKATGDGDREPGDFAWTWFGPADKEGMDKKKESELLNGRLAMIAVGGIATQSIVSGHGFPYV
mmetsp:Transcript_5793/g.8200  ORF Transcript_5793/g.8200 Transcript_5793/m.8200 type:complete len:199 (-) Transcript_5793:185-781(-)